MSRDQWSFFPLRGRTKYTQPWRSIEASNKVQYLWEIPSGSASTDVTLARKGEQRKQEWRPGVFGRVLVTSWVSSIYSVQQTSVMLNGQECFISVWPAKQSQAKAKEMNKLDTLARPIADRFIFNMFLNARYYTTSPAYLF